MRLVATIALAGLALHAAAVAGADAPKIDRADFVKVSQSVDNGLHALWPDYPMELVGVTHAVYIRGFGAVLTGEVNLAPGHNPTPFHPNTTKQDIAITRKQKLERMDGLKKAMEQLLVKSAKDLREVPDSEEVALALSLFYWHWEDRTGLPDQIVMHASRKALLDAKDGASLAAAVHVEEY